jgi:DNA-binding response OmpR family regulator
METARTPRILVVDDEPPLVELVRGYLGREGFEILTAGDGPTAVQVVRDEMPDLVAMRPWGAEKG